MYDKPGRHPPIALLLVVALIAAAAAGFDAHAAAIDLEGAPTGPGTACGGTLWRQMAFSDLDRAKVNLTPVATSIAQIGALSAPAKIGLARSTAFQRHTWHLHAVIDRYRIASNGEIVLVLFDIDTGRYMDAYMPNPICLSAKTRDRAAIVAARQALTKHCPRVTASWQLVGVTTEVTGIGFWNPVRSTRGALPNGAELRPIVGLTIDTGCGAG